MKNPARWLIVAAVVWAAIVSGFLTYLAFTWQQSGTNTGFTLYESNGLTAIAIVLAPFVWVVLTAGVAWAASHYRLLGLSILAGVMTLAFGTLCALTILAVFTPLPIIGIAFGGSAVLLLIAIFTDRVVIKGERQLAALAQLPPPHAVYPAISPGAPHSL